MNKVRQFRLAAGMTQDALAQAAGCTTQTIYNIERRGNKPRLALALRLASILGTTIEDLFPTNEETDGGKESA